jgi:hypothetical protein
MRHTTNKEEVPEILEVTCNQLRKKSRLTAAFLR